MIVNIWTLIGLSLIFLLQFIVLCDALNKDDLGVCEVQIAKKKTRLKIKTRRCGKRTCTVKVVETYIEKIPTPTCCEGWEYVQADDVCKAQCRLGCERGTCVAPDDCRCDPPLKLENNNTCVEPKCEPACVNSHCVDTNTCACDPPYITFNSTHCAPKCESGYTNDPRTLECVPVCDELCVNSTCTGPNTCSCFDGHKLKESDNYTCVPDCNPSCVNADCVAPDVCSCFDGYRAESKWQCSPVCDVCQHGDCIAPNICKCHEGYSKKNLSVCTPDCDRECLNGFCSEPNTCTCKSGYEVKSTDKFNCLPICEPKCVNASCVSPNKCSCFNGYETAGSEGICRPKCDECENGECVAPNECRCHKGYSKKNGKCSPDCDVVCKNGYCSKPNVCTCNDGFQIDNNDKFTCNPICKPSCVNATCDSPNSCTCLYGYLPTKDKFVCKPKCTSCSYGDCIAPDVCKCRKGYNMTKGICTPICINPCVNGNCSTPNHCTCNEGYIRNNTEPTVCYKPCEGPCHNGTCNLHGVCICSLGYELDNHTCTAIKPIDCNSCKSNCTNDVCWCSNGKPCVFAAEVESAEVASNTSLAGLELTWLVAGAVTLLLFGLLVMVIGRLARRRNTHEGKKADECNPYGSVVYTIPDTLMQRNGFHDNGNNNDDVYDEATEAFDDDDIKKTSERLLNPDVSASHVND